MLTSTAKHLFLTYLTVAAATMAATFSAEPLHEAYIVNKAESATYRLTNKEHKGYGTGFSVYAPSGNSYILTNRHVCEGLDRGAGELLVYAPYDSRKRVRPLVRKIIEIDSEHDLCLVEDVPYSLPVRLSDSSPSRGSTVGVIGHPGGSEEPVLSKGSWLSIRPVLWPMFQVFDEQDEARCHNQGGKVYRSFFFGVCLKALPSVLSTVKIYPGNSGSAVWNFWGEVVGVVWGADNRTNFGVFVPLDAIETFLSPY